MKTLEEQLARYATCHRDRRNIATHFVGIPMIMAAVAVLLSRPVLLLAGASLTPAALVVAFAMIFYLRLDLGLAAVMAVLLSAALAFGAWAASQPTAIWLAIGSVALVTGFVLQFIGHFCEGRKPAFVDDLTGLLVGPLFLVAELMFALGLRRVLQRHIESVAGPTRIGEPVHAGHRHSATAVPSGRTARASAPADRPHKPGWRKLTRHHRPVRCESRATAATGNDKPAGGTRAARPKGSRARHSA